MKKTSVSIIFLTVMLDLVGFGLVLPLIPVYASNFGAKGIAIGAIMSSYSVMQFIFSPIWGRLSDRVGRRPVLLGSTACACLSYVIFAIGSAQQGNVALWIIVASRVFAGICGANITVAQAYIADVTPPELRSAKMALIGMAFGLGFVLGPLIGGIATHFFGMTAPGWVAASLCALNFLWAFARLGESWKPSAHSETPRTHVEQWLHVLRTPKLNLLVGIFFLATFCFASFETTIGLLIKKEFNLNDAKSLTSVSWLIFYCGVIGALVQGGTRRFVKRLGESRLISVSLLFAAIGMGLVPFAATWGILLIGLGVFAVGSSLTRPPVFGMISNLTASHEQGATMGVAQGVGSLARIFGPPIATGLFFFSPKVPYLICAVLCFITCLIAGQYLGAKKP